MLTYDSYRYHFDFFTDMRRRLLVDAIGSTIDAEDEEFARHLGISYERVRDPVIYPDFVEVIVSFLDYMDWDTYAPRHNSKEDFADDVWVMIEQRFERLASHFPEAANLLFNGESEAEFPT